MGPNTIGGTYINERFDQFRLKNDKFILSQALVLRFNGEWDIIINLYRATTANKQPINALCTEKKDLTGQLKKLKKDLKDLALNFALRNEMATFF